MTSPLSQTMSDVHHAKRDWDITPSSLVYSYHAAHRATLRSITPADLAYILTYGRAIQRTGVSFYFLARKDIRAAGSRAGWARRLEGTVILVSKDGAIITVYRNRKALHDIKRKMKYR